MSFVFDNIYGGKYLNLNSYDKIEVKRIDSNISIRFYKIDLNLESNYSLIDSIEVPIDENSTMEEGMKFEKEVQKKLNILLKSLEIGEDFIK